MDHRATEAAKAVIGHPTVEVVSMGMRSLPSEELWNLAVVSRNPHAARQCVDDILDMLLELDDVISPLSCVAGNKMMAAYDLIEIAVARIDEAIAELAPSRSKDASIT